MSPLSKEVKPVFLYLVRHGEANKEEDEARRGLTDRGVREVTMAADYARGRSVKPTIIYHSGKKRALQTAQIFSDYLKPKKGITEADDLDPMDDTTPWARRISDMNEDVMLVGHLPYLARLTGLLLAEDREKMFIDFKTGAIVCLKRSENREWTLEWMLSPDTVL